jgi:formylglycine-generating enzyme required for sulfatase activity
MAMVCATAVLHAPAAAAGRQAAPLTEAEEGALKPKDTFQECPACPEMVVVPAGSFTMGSPLRELGHAGDEGPLRRVTIARPFAVGRLEVTFAEWDACVADGGCTYRPGDQGWGRGRLPVMKVSWNDITKQYLPWLSSRTGKTYRLPTEAEWEYAARAGTTTPFWWGAAIATAQANYNGDEYDAGPAGEYRGRTVLADSFAANPWGLYSVLGNVAEWVEDCYHDSYRGAPSDGSAWTSGDCSRRIVRGGSWDDGPRALRAARREALAAFDRVIVAGFRVVRVLAP